MLSIYIHVLYTKTSLYCLSDSDCIWHIFLCFLDVKAGDIKDWSC